MYNEGQLRRREKKCIIVSIIAIQVLVLASCYSCCYIYRGGVICIILICIIDLLISIGFIYFIHIYTKRKIERYRRASMLNQRGE